MKSDVIKYLASVYPLQHAAIGNLYDVVKNHYMPCSDLEILEKCDVIIKKALQYNNFIITQHPIKFQPFDKSPDPPPLRPPIDYTKKRYRKKLEGVKKFFINIINKASHEK